LCGIASGCLSATHGNDTIEANSLDTCKLHLRHFGFFSSEQN
jgi:hypothetical protein